MQSYRQTLDSQMNARGLDKQEKMWFVKDG